MDIKVEDYVPVNLIPLGYGLVACGLVMIFSTPWSGIGLILLGLILLTTHHRLEVHLEKKYYSEYVWVLGFKSEKKLPIKTFNIFISRNQMCLGNMEECCGYEQQSHNDSMDT